jgi:hypothetical protein
VTCQQYQARAISDLPSRISYVQIQALSYFGELVREHSRQVRTNLGSTAVSPIETILSHDFVVAIVKGHQPGPSCVDFVTRHS